MIPTLSFLVLSLIFHTKALDGGTRGALRQQILAGAEIYLTPAAPESERTIDANWIKEALKKHVRIRIHNAIIQGRLDLRNTVIDQEIDLGGCTVKDYADFSYTTFKREFFASDADFVSPASFQNTTFERKATFQHIRFEGNNINFSDAHFLEEFDATQAQFGSMGDGTVMFTRARFDKTAAFPMSVFSINAQFIETHFFGQGFFSGVRFKRNADFTRAHFSDFTSFDVSPPSFNSTFEGWAIFIEAQFDSHVWFNGASFKSRAIFLNTRFGSPGAGSSGVEFRGATFNTAEFNSTKFDADASFEKAIFEGPSSFHSAAFRAVYFPAADFMNDIDLLGCTYDRIQVDLRSLLRYPKPNGRPRIRPYDRQPYVQLEEVLRKTGFETDADEVYAERRRVENGEGWRKFWDRLYWLVGNYGIDLWHEFYGSLGVLLIGTLIFSRRGAVIASEGEPGIATRISPWDAFFLAVHQFLPFSLPVKPRWDPSRLVLWRILAAATYANFLRIIGWILIPLAAAAWTGILRHATP